MPLRFPDRPPAAPRERLRGPRSPLPWAGLFRFCVESPFPDAFSPFSGLPGPVPGPGFACGASRPRPDPSAPRLRAPYTHYLLMPKSLDRGYNM